MNAQCGWVPQYSNIDAYWFNGYFTIEDGWFTPLSQGRADLHAIFVAITALSDTSHWNLSLELGFLNAMSADERRLSPLLNVVWYCYSAVTYSDNCKHVVFVMVI